MKLGIIREGKVPADSRVALAPAQCAAAREQFGVDLVVEPMPSRCFSDEEYAQSGIALSTDLSDRDLLLGVKEVPIAQLLPEKTYCFFSHTIKKQAHNRELLRAILAKRIRLIDYEVLTDDHGKRLIAFGRFAGMVGAHNALWTAGNRSGDFSLPRLKDCRDYSEALQHYRQLRLPPLRIVLTGTGRVGSGAAEVLRDMGIRQAPAMEFLKHDFQEAVFTQLRVHHYIARADGQPYDTRDYYREPVGYTSVFEPYFQRADIFINGIFWDHRAPAFFSKADMRREDFRIRTIADITCDIAPESSVPSTLRASTIEEPVYGYDPFTESETPPYQPGVIDVMAIDNLPNELPRDASEAFGQQFLNHILPEFFRDHSPMLDRATIARNGELGKRYEYLRGFVEPPVETRFIASLEHNHDK